MYVPRWSDNSYPDFDYQNISYYSAPKRRPQLDSIEEVDPALRQTWERLNIPVEEQKRLANVKPVRWQHVAELWKDAGGTSSRRPLEASLASRWTQLSGRSGGGSPVEQEQLTWSSQHMPVPAWPCRLFAISGGSSLSARGALSRGQLHKICRP